MRAIDAEVVELGYERCRALKTVLVAHQLNGAANGTARANASSAARQDVERRACAWRWHAICAAPVIVSRAALRAVAVKYRTDPFLPPNRFTVQRWEKSRGDTDV